jgi:hypothetical protein
MPRLPPESVLEPELEGVLEEDVVLRSLREPRE